MLKILIASSLILIKINSFCQIAALPEKVDSILTYSGYNDKFIKLLNREFDNLIDRRVDTVFLLYPVPDYYFTEPFAIIIWKNKSTSQCLVFYQPNFNGSDIKTEISKNDTLSNIEISNLYKISIDEKVRMIDTNIYISHQPYIYTQFYFDQTKILRVGYSNWVYQMISDSFRKALINESLRMRMLYNIKQ